MLGWAESEDGGPIDGETKDGDGSGSQAWDRIAAKSGKTILGHSEIFEVTEYEVLAVHIAPILLLVDPIDDVLMATLQRFLYALASAPRTRRVLCSEPL